MYQLMCIRDFPEGIRRKQGVLVYYWDWCHLLGSNRQIIHFFILPNLINKGNSTFIEFLPQAFFNSDLIKSNGSS